MKTSNKILLGLLIIIFTVPLLLAYSIKSKIKKGEYTVVKYETSKGEMMMRTGSFTAFKVVKVVAPGPRFLTCHLKPSDDMSYLYHSQQEDSIVVSNSNDTLYISFAGRKNLTDGEETPARNDLAIKVKLPAFNNLIVDGAVVVIDSLPASMGSFSVTLKNKGVVKDGSKAAKKETSKAVPVKIKKDEASPVASIYKKDVIDESDKRKMTLFPKAAIALPELNMKELIVSCLLRRIS